MKENGKVGQEKGTGEIKNTHEISIGTMKVKRTLEDLGLHEMLQTV
jgi:hypothetical protein